MTKRPSKRVQKAEAINSTAFRIVAQATGREPLAVTPNEVAAELAKIRASANTKIKSLPVRKKTLVPLRLETLVPAREATPERHSSQKKRTPQYLDNVHGDALRITAVQRR